SEAAAPGVPDVRDVQGRAGLRGRRDLREGALRIALDAMGTDRHPDIEVAGALQALRELPADFELLLVGDEPRIASALAAQEPAPAGRLHIVHAEETVAPGEPPATAGRRKRKSSISVGLGLQKEDRADAFVSAGSTGAVMAASLFLL